MADLRGEETDELDTDQDESDLLFSSETSFEDDEVYSELFSKDASGTPIITYGDIIPALQLASPYSLRVLMDSLRPSNTQSYMHAVYTGRVGNRFKILFPHLREDGPSLGVGVQALYDQSGLYLHANERVILLGVPVQDVQSGVKDIPSIIGRQRTPVARRLGAGQPISLDCPPVLLEISEYSFFQDIKNVPKVIWDSPEFPERLFPREYVFMESDFEKQEYAKAASDATSLYLPISRLQVDGLRPQIRGYLLEAVTSKVIARDRDGRQRVDIVRDWQRILNQEAVFEYHFERQAWINQENGKNVAYKGNLTTGWRLRLECALEYQFYLVGDKYQLHESSTDTRWIYSFMRYFQDWYHRGPAFQTKYQTADVYDRRIPRPDIPQKYF